MALGESAKLVAELDLKNNMAGPAGQAIGQLDKIEKKVGTLRIATGVALGNAFTNIGNFAVKGIGKAFGFLEAGIASLSELDTLNRQTAAVIQSTGAKAGVTAGQVRDLASSLEDVTTVDDKVVQSGENLLLTFTGIGKGVFPRATKAMVDMAVALNHGNAEGVDLSSTAIQLGKALNDPVKGITALQRVGVSFTQQQKDQIAAMVKAGDVAGAQGVILKELETEFGKAGEAAGTGYAADMRRFKDAVEGAQQALAVGFLPIIQEVTQWLNEKLRDPKVIQAIKDLGTSGAALLEKGFQAIKDIPWSQVGEAFRLMGLGAKAAFDLFTGLPPWVQTAVITGWGLNKLTGGALSSVVSSLATGLIKGVLGITAAVVNVNAAKVNGGGGLPGAGAGGAGIGGALVGLAGSATLIGAVTLAADQISRLPTALAGAQESLSIKTAGDIKQAWNDTINGSTLGTAFKPLIDAILTHIPGASVLNGPGGRVSVQDGLLGSDGMPVHTRVGTSLNPSPGTQVMGPGFTEWMHSQTQQSSDQVQELGRIHQLQADQLGVMTGTESGIAALPAGLSAFLAKWSGARDAAIAAGFKANTQAIRREIASKLGITIKELVNLRHANREALASELGITVGELRHLNRTFDFDETKIAAKLGISVDQLRALKAEAATTAANTTKLKNKDWTPTIPVSVKVDSTFSVSGRAVAQASERFWSINRPRVT